MAKSLGKYLALLRGINVGGKDIIAKDESRKHNALFTLGSATPKGLVNKLPEPKSGMETVSIAPGVIFWSISNADQNKNTYAKLASNPIYRQVTIRNHNTVLKLQQMLAEI